MAKNNSKQRRSTPAATRSRPRTSPPYDHLPDFMTVEQTMDYLQSGRSSTYHLIKTGEIPSIRFGGMIRVPKTGIRDKASR